MPPLTFPSAFPDWALSPPAQGTLNEQQTISFVGTPISGSFVLNLGTAASPAIPWNATAAQVQTAINDIYAAATATVTGGAAPTSFVADFGTNSLTNFVAQMTVSNNTLLTAGAAQVQVVVNITQASQEPALVNVDSGHTNNGFSLFEYPPFNIFNQWMALVGQGVRWLYNNVIKLLGFSKGENLFRNGNFIVAQRGSSGIVTAGSPVYTVDGWIVGSVTNNLAWSQNLSSLGGATLNLNLAPSGGTPTDAFIKQRIESLVMDGIPTTGWMTVQWTIENLSGADITPTLSINYANSVDNFSSVTSFLAATPLQKCTNGTQTIVSYTFQANVNLFLGMEVILDFGAGIAGIGIYLGFADISYSPNLTTAGLQANPPLPQSRPIGIEIQNCLRYFQTWGGDATTSFVAFGTITSSTLATISLPFITKMMAIPSLSDANPTNFQLLDLNNDIGYNLTAIGGTSIASTQGALLAVSHASGGTVGDSCVLKTTNANARINLSAEL